MRNLKDGIRSIVRITYDNKVHKKFRGTDSDKRYQNEKEILQILQQRKCPFVPQILDFDDQSLTLVTSNCGQPVDRISNDKMRQLFRELEQKYGIVHQDQDKRNITYNPLLARFSIIDFELAENIWQKKTSKKKEQTKTEKSNFRALWSARTTTGSFRKYNEDSLAAAQFQLNPQDKKRVNIASSQGIFSTIKPGSIFAIADGMGGGPDGKEASWLAIREITSFIQNKILQIRNFSTKTEKIQLILTKALEKTHKTIEKKATQRQKQNKGLKMGTTLSCCWLLEDKMHIAHIGDSRIYKLSEQNLTQISKDHSYVGSLFRKNLINERQARNHPAKSILQQLLGAGIQKISPQICTQNIKKEDIILLCSDGLNAGLWDKNIKSALLKLQQESKKKDINSIYQNIIEFNYWLIGASLNASGTDNITSILLKLL